MRPAKIYQLALRNPGGLRFHDLCRLAEAFGFDFQRQRGSHRVYAHEGLRELMIFQDDRSLAKAYQVRQLLGCIARNRLTLGERNT